MVFSIFTPFRQSLCFPFPVHAIELFEPSAPPGLKLSQSLFLKFGPQRRCSIAKFKPLLNPKKKRSARARWWSVDGDARGRQVPDPMRWSPILLLWPRNNIEPPPRKRWNVFLGDFLAPDFFHVLHVSLVHLPMIHSDVCACKPAEQRTMETALQTSCNKEVLDGERA